MLLSRGRDIEVETEKPCRGLLVHGNGEMKKSIPRRNKEGQAAIESGDCSGNPSFEGPEGLRKVECSCFSLSLSYISSSQERIKNHLLNK